MSSHITTKELQVLLERALHDAPSLRIAMELGRSQSTIERRLMQEGIYTSPPRNKQRIRDVIEALNRRETLIEKLQNYFKQKGSNN